VAGEDDRLEPAQVGARLDAELGHQPGAGPPVGLQRLALPAGPVERAHEQLPQPLPQRVSGHQRLELGGGAGVATEGELGGEEVLGGVEPDLLQPGHLGTDPLPGRAAGQHVAAPQPKRRPQRVGLDLRAPRGPGAGHQLLEDVRVDVLDRRGQHVAGCLGGDELPEPAGDEASAQIGDVRPERLGRAVRWAGVPDTFDKGVARDNIRGAQGERADQRAQPRPAQWRHPAPVDHLDRTEQTDLNGGQGGDTDGNGGHRPHLRARETAAADRQRYAPRGCPDTVRLAYSGRFTRHIGIIPR
jgi:hypothetical protein